MQSFYHCLKSVRIRSYPGPYFPTFELNKFSTNVEKCGSE